MRWVESVHVQRRREKRQNCVCISYHVNVIVQWNFSNSDEQKEKPNDKKLNERAFLLSSSHIPRILFSQSIFWFSYVQCIPVDAHGSRSAKKYVKVYYMVVAKRQTCAETQANALKNEWKRNFSTASEHFSFILGSLSTACVICVCIVSVLRHTIRCDCNG